MCERGVGIDRLRERERVRESEREREIGGGGTEGVEGEGGK